MSQSQAIRVSANRNLAMGGSGICVATFGRIVMLLIIYSLLRYKYRLLTNREVLFRLCRMARSLVSSDIHSILPVCHSEIITKSKKITFTSQPSFMSVRHPRSGGGWVVHVHHTQHSPGAARFADIRPSPTHGARSGATPVSLWAG